MDLRAAEPLGPQHRFADFDCGEPSLGDWLRRRAVPNQASGASRTFVVCEGAEVRGYHALAAGAVAASDAPGRFRRNMPDPIPVILLARLGVDRRAQGRGLGRALAADAMRRAADAADQLGARGLLTHALSEEAKAFYLRLGFSESPLHPLTLMVTMDDIRAALRA